MTTAWAEWIVVLGGAYVGAGALFAALFITAGLQRIDPAAQGMPWLARVLLVPGLAALWPLMLVKWLRRAQPPVA